MASLPDSPEGKTKNPACAGFSFGATVDRLRRGLRVVVTVKVDRADLRAVAAEVEHASRETVPCVAQLGRVHRELPAGMERVDEVRFLRRNIGPRETVLGLTDVVPVDD